MAARLSDSEPLVELHDIQLLERPRTRKGGRIKGTSLQENKKRSNKAILQPLSIAVPDTAPISSISSLPTVSDIPLSAATMQQHPSTGQLEPKVIRRTRLADLISAFKNSIGLSDTLKTHLTEAESCIQNGKHAEAIPSLEEAVLVAKDVPKLQCVLWRLLGNAHLSLGHYKKASVCHMHQLAFCRELDDFSGMTTAECNLGITYMKQGLLKLSERCFVQYLENSKILQDEMSIAYAFSNLGVLAKSMAIQEYYKTEGQDRNEKLKNKKMIEKFKEHLRKAIYYFEQHLEIVERHSDL